MTKNIDERMAAIPSEWRHRWCESGACACMGCVQIGNRIAMFEETSKSKFFGDPEHINETVIPHDIYQKHKISKSEWKLWVRGQNK